MEVVVTEEKKKIFRARKTMKISDRLQLESLHSTLLTTPGLSNPSPPPLMNGTHKEDGQKVGDKEQNNISDSNSPRATPPASPISLSSPSPFLSLNLSPSPVSSESPKPQDDITSPTSPFASDFTDLKKTEDEEKKSSSPPHSNETVTPVPSEHKDQDKNVITTGEKEEEEKTRAEGPAGDSGKNSAKDVVSCSPVPPAVSECIEPMEIETDTTNAGHSEASTLTKTDEKPSSSNVAASSSSSSSPTPHPTSSKDLGETIEIKDDDTKEEEDDKLNKKTASESEEKMEVDKIKSEVKKEMKDVGKSTKPARPSSTPPSNADKEEKNSTSGLKRTLSEGDEKDEVTVKKEGKRPKVEHEELEAQLKLKITAKAGSQHKLEKIVQHLVNEQLKILELAIFDKHFKELKDRVDKIDCATKHQTTINSLQSKISRLAKKFGEANQASENRKKQEALAAANTAVAVAAAVAAVKTPTVTNTPQAQRVLRGQAVAPKPEVPREAVAPPLGNTPVLSVKEEREEEEEEEDDDEEEDMGEEKESDMARHIAMAKKLAEYSEGKCRSDVKLRPISSRLESVLYHNCKRGSEKPRPDRYASYLFRYLVPYEIYCEWVAKVNYVGLMGKEALPINLRRTIRMYIERRFPFLHIDRWREIRDVINEILRVKRKPEFFREPVRTSTEVKQTPASVPSSSTAVSLPATIAAPASAPIPVPIPVPARALTLAPAPVSAPALVTAPPPAPTSTSNTTMVPQGSILQLITSNANAASTLATGITTQSQQGTLLLKTTSGSGIMATGQPLVIQLPLSVNGQTGTLVNFPVSSLSAASSLNKAKTTPSTTTFILKSPSSTNTVSATTSTVATLPTLQPSTGQVSTTQISLARAVYQGGAGRITTPNAGVSMTTVRAPVQSVSVAGALSSASSPATSGPAATGSTAPGTPQGTSLTSKTDNQVSVTIPSKPPVPPAAPARPKGSVIDLTEDDDDVQVTGVKNATVTTSSPAPRSNPVISIPNSAGSRSSPKTNQSSASSPQITVHHRPPLDSSMKPRTVTTTTPSRGSSSSLPALPSAPAPSRLPAEAEQTSPPQQLQLKLVPGQTGIVLSWSVAETDRSCAAVDSYHLYAFHQDNSNSGSAQQHWKKIGEVNALPLPMACTLTQFQSGSTYYFAVRAKDIYGRFGTFCEPQCTNVISSSSS